MPHQYGIILRDGQQVGVWKALVGNHMELNFEDDELQKVLDTTEVVGETTLQFMIDPEQIE